MIILIDLSQVMISSLMEQIKDDKNMEINTDLIRHIVLNSLRSYIKRFRTQYGNMVIACDSKHSWRKDVFPFYKANRKKAREDSILDWNLVFESLNMIRDELKENFPYKVVEVSGAEADDVIAILTEKATSEGEKVLIVSSDKDFIQLQKFANVDQYSPILTKFIKIDRPDLYLKEHIIRGDRGDGIPNILSSDNIFMIDERQKSVMKKNFDVWITQEPEVFCTTDTMLRGYKRNEVLVDFSKIPEKIRTPVLDQFETMTTGTKSKLMTYFIEKRLINLISTLDEY